MENIIDTIKSELLDTKTRLEIKLIKESMNIDKDSKERIKIRIWRLKKIIKCLDSLNSIPLK